MKGSPFSHDLTREIQRAQFHRQQAALARHRLVRALAVGGTIGLACLFARALGALALQDGHDLWLILPSVITLVWGAWGFHHLLTRH